MNKARNDRKNAKHDCPCQYEPENERNLSGLLAVSPLHGIEEVIQPWWGNPWGSESKRFHEIKTQIPTYL